jgi:hypothetical protein
MAFVARWSIEVQFGRKQDLFTLNERWEKWSKERGWPAARVLVNAIGGSEARVEFEHTVETLADLEKMWGALPHDDAFRAWQKDMAGLVVPGSPRWEVWRIIK